MANYSARELMWIAKEIDRIPAPSGHDSMMAMHMPTEHDFLNGRVSEDGEALMSLAHSRNLSAKEMAQTVRVIYLYAQVYRDDSRRMTWYKWTLETK